MKIEATLFFLIVTYLLAGSGCVKQEALEIQKPFNYDEKCNNNMSAYKKTNHTLCIGWYAAYAPIAGATGYKDPASWVERIMGLPDSMDIVSLWMGIPSNDPAKSSYAPV